MKVYLSPLAEKKTQLLLKFLETEWSTKSKDEFVSKLLNKFSQISNQPKNCPESKAFSGLYKCIVTKQTSFFFYRIKADEIEVITVTDNRQEPEIIQQEIKEHFG
jgi:plasmid stabilization system protein ParE